MSIIQQQQQEHQEHKYSCFIKQSYLQQGRGDVFPLKRHALKGNVSRFRSQSSQQVNQVAETRYIYKINVSELEKRYELENIYFEEEGKTGEVIMGNVLVPNSVYIIKGDSTKPPAIAPDASANALDPMRGRTVLAYDQRMKAHFGHASHPEKPARLTEIWNTIEEREYHRMCVVVEGTEVSRNDLLYAHSESYIDAIEYHGSSHLTRDTSVPVPELSRTTDVYMNEYSCQAALIAAGCAVSVVEKVVMEGAKNGFAIVRPPGHHAYRDKASGFCLYNNVALAAKVAVNRLGLERVLVVDWDVHHGNGTQDILYDDDRILVFSMHRHGGFYPGTGDMDEVGAECALGKNINVPFSVHHPYGDGDALFVWNHILVPVAYEFKPDLIIVSAGFDAVEGDPLGEMQMTPQIYGHLIRLLEPTVPNGRIVLCLEGGYKCDTVAHCVSECIKVLLGQQPSSIPDQYGSIVHNERTPSGHHMDMYRRVLRTQARYWRSLAFLES